MHQEQRDRLQRVFSRTEQCVFGLPFDVVNETTAIDLLDRAIGSEQRCFLSTPNLNFAIAAMDDEEFRESVLQSDLSVADGMPLILISRLLGEPLPERVAGSSLFEKMRLRENCPTISVFFFGGMGDVAERAAENLNQSSPGMRAVGALNPGLGSVEDMSSAEILDRVNDANPDFLVVSLGAKKGQSWILANRDKLNARVQSHLGAVVNFVAGTVNRAPVLWQKLGLEWIWRIIEEPGLWKRYFFDGLTFCGSVLTKVIPLAIYGRYLRKRYSDERLRYSISNEERGTRLCIAGVAASEGLSELKTDIPEMLLQRTSLIVDLKGLEYADGTFWALLLRLRTESKRLDIAFRIENPSPRLARLARLNFLEELLQISDS